MLGYILFIVPMSIAFVWILRKHGLRQALLDLLAFNLLFSFDFSAILPNNTTLLLVHVILLALIGIESLRLRHLSTWCLSRRLGAVLLATGIFVSWMVVAEYLNKTEWWTIGRITTDSIFTYVLPVLFIVVGIELADNRRLVRFCKIFLVACSLASVIAVAQTASYGQLFSNFTSDNYLGIFQPLGAKTLQRRDAFVSAVNYLDFSKIIRFGNLSFYRGDGPFEGADVSLCTVAAAVLALLVSRDKSVSRWLFVPFFLSVAGFFAAFNRTSILTFALVTVGVLCIRFRSLLTPRVIRRWLIPIAVAALFIIINLQPISQVVAANLDGFFGTRANEVSSLNGRTGLWQRVLSQIAHSPIIGTGQPNTPLSVGWGTDNNPDNDLGAHNSFLQFALRGGVMPGLIFVLLYLFCLFRLFNLAFSWSIPRQQRIIYFALLTAAICFFLLNLTGSWMVIPLTAPLFWILCGYAAAHKVYRNQIDGPILSSAVQTTGPELEQMP